MEDRLGRRARIRERERALLVGLITGRDDAEAQETLQELRALCETAGVEVLHVLCQRRARPDASYFIGKGKAHQLKELTQASAAQAVVFNDELTPAQGRNLEELLNVKVIDRAQLILDIFAQRARTKESRLQVERAQLEYLLPRLRGWGEALSRLGGGIGTRGPGETRLALERQAIRRRLHRIKAQLEKVERERALKRKRRSNRGVPQVVLVGYTNTGKSTLLNALSEADAHVEDKLFATLDPLVRRVTLPRHGEAVLADTVGFIRKLPHELVPAFRATLEAVEEAAVLLHVLDASDPEPLRKWETVREVLSERFGDRPWPPLIHVLNKADLLTTPEARGHLQALKDRLGRGQTVAVEVSALKGTNLEALREAIARALGPRRKLWRVRLPYAQAARLERLHRWGEVQTQSYDPEGIVVEVRLGGEHQAELERWADEDGVSVRVLD